MSTAQQRTRKPRTAAKVKKLPHPVLNLSFVKEGKRRGSGLNHWCPDTSAANKEHIDWEWHFGEILAAEYIAYAKEHEKSGRDAAATFIFIVKSFPSDYSGIEMGFLRIFMRLTWDAVGCGQSLRASLAVEHDQQRLAMERYYDAEKWLKDAIRCGMDPIMYYDLDAEGKTRIHGLFTEEPKKTTKTPLRPELAKCKDLFPHMERKGRVKERTATLN